MTDVSMEDIPLMIEELLTIQKREIDRMKKAKRLDNGEILTSIRMLQQLSNTYLQYTLFQESLKKTVRGMPYSAVESKVRSMGLEGIQQIAINSLIPTIPANELR